MLSVEANERLSKVGKGTPGGELMRRYWHPIAPASSFLDEPVQPVRILGEDLVLYRRPSGGFGLVGPSCAHRSTALEYGIPEDAGLRCPYHGWLYGPDGQCLDTPLEPAKSRLKDRIKIPGYPVQELGGLLWAYLGPDPVPVLPRWDLFAWPRAIRQIGICVIPCNWLQCHENAFDPLHSVWLHGHYFKYLLERRGELETRADDPAVHRAYRSIAGGDGAEKIWARQSQYGVQKGVIYSKALGADSDENRVHSDTIFPYYTRPGGGGIRYEFQIRVPMDDTHTYHINYQMFLVPDAVDFPMQETVPWFEIPEVDENGKTIQDFVFAQDRVAWATQGNLADRSQENLGASDAAIAVYRKILDEQIKINEDGGEPMNVFHDPSAVGDIIHLDPPLSGQLPTSFGPYWKKYATDNHDRYSPVLNDVFKLMDAVESAAAGK